MLIKWPLIGSNRLHTCKAVASEQHSLPSTRESTSPLNPFGHSFDPTSLVDTAPRKCLKRSHPQEEFDGAEHMQRKKRRLRLDLVTSRLSKPYATPTTHIVGRSHSRVGIWARQKLAGGKLLRKAAILNSIVIKSKRGIIGAETGERPTTSDSSRDGSAHIGLGAFTWDYDELDREDNALGYNDEDMDEEGNDAEEIDNSQSVYSDFNMLDSSDPAPEFGDASYSFDSLNTGYSYAVDPGGKALDLVMENEGHNEVSVAPKGSAHSRPFLPSVSLGFRVA